MQEYMVGLSAQRVRRSPSQTKILLLLSAPKSGEVSADRALLCQVQQRFSERVSLRRRVAGGLGAESADGERTEAERRRGQQKSRRMQTKCGWTESSRILSPNCCWGSNALVVLLSVSTANDTLDSLAQ